MKVAVLGSFRKADISAWDLEYEDAFFDTCRHIGWALAKSGCSLVAPRSVNETNAEKYVCSGFKKVKTKGEIIDVSVSSGARTWASAHVLAAIHADAVILIGGTEGTYEAGRAAIELHKIVIPIPCFGGAARVIIQYIKKKNIRKPMADLMSVSPVDDTRWYPSITKTVTSLLSYPKFLLIHGRCRDRDIVKDIIMNSNIEQMPEPIVMADNALEAKTIPDLFEGLANNVHAAIAIVTPDDLAFSCREISGGIISPIELGSPIVRARENIWLELGWFWGRLGRSKVLILRQRSVTIPTDLSGIYCLEYNHSPVEVKTELEQFILKLRKHEI